MANVIDLDGGEDEIQYTWEALPGNPHAVTLEEPSVFIGDVIILSTPERPYSNELGSENVILKLSGLQVSDTPYQFKLTATDAHGASSYETYTVNASHTNILRIIDENPSFSGTNYSESQGYTVRVFGTPGDSLSLLADFGGIANDTGGRMIVKSISNTIIADINTLVLSSSFTFSLGIGPDGYTDIKTTVTAFGTNQNTGGIISGRLRVSSELNRAVVMSAKANGVTDTTCFDVETYVSLANGRSKKLKNIEKGDELIGFSFTNNSSEDEKETMKWRGVLAEAIKTTVTVVKKESFSAPMYYEITTDDGKVIKVTGEHPLLTTENQSEVKWTKASDVFTGMYLIDRKGETKKVTQFKLIKKALEVAVLDVESIDNYVIGDIVAHNAEIVLREDGTVDNVTKK